MIQRWAFLLFLVTVTATVNAQRDPENNVDLERLADELFGFQDLDVNYQELYENMAQLLSNPININTASADELRFLNLLSEEQVQNLMLYRTENGDLLSVYELQVVPGFDPLIAEKMMPFVTTEPRITGKSLLNRILHEENNYLIIRSGGTLEKKNGFTNTANEKQFIGTREDLYVRFRTSNPGDFSVGFTAEKDAGEALAINAGKKQYAFDFYSAHAQILNKGKIKNLIVGDFQTQFGQGLLLGGSGGIGKGSETITTIRRSNVGFLPYTSALESGFKRGVAVSVNALRHLQLSAFYSNAPLDANIADDSASSFQSTGFHRNKDELGTRHQVREQSTGLIINFSRHKLETGLIFHTLKFSTAIYPQPQPYNQFDFTGKELYNASVYGNYTINNVVLFGEAARSLRGGSGFTVGMLGALSSKLDIALLARHYQRNFHSLHGNAFAESSRPKNETGIYWGWKYKFPKRITAAFYADLFKFPWLRFRNYSPTDGHEVLLHLNYQPSKTVNIFFQGREEVKSRNTSDETVNQYSTAEGEKRNFCLSADYQVTPNLRLKTRAQFSTYTIGGAYSDGMVLFQDIRTDLGKFAIEGRYALFDTDDFDNRQYIYERDVWLAYSLPAFSGTGVRSYVLVEYKATKSFTLWFRFASIRYTNQSSIGSGMDLIEGDTKRDWRIQTRIKF